MLRAVAADAEVHGLAPGVVFFPDLLRAVAFPAFRDGVADEEQFGIGRFLDALVEEIGADLPVQGARHGHDGRVRGGLRVGEKRGRENAGNDERAECFGSHGAEG